MQRHGLLWAELHLILQFLCWSLNPQNLKSWLYLKTESLNRWLNENEAIRQGHNHIWLMSSWEQVIKTQTSTYAERKLCEDTGRKCHLHAKGSGLRSWHCDLGLLAFKLEGNTILLFKPPGLWFFVMGAADQSRL